MKKKQIFSIAATALLSLLLAAGVAAAATEWPGDNTFTGIVNWFPNGIKIGQQGSGGVTFFNGTIINQTTTDGKDNPVAFGDNVRIDGTIYRGIEAGPFAGVSTEDMPVKIDDDLEVAGKSVMKGKVIFEGGTEGIDAYSKSESDDRFIQHDDPRWDAIESFSSITRYAFHPSDNTSGFDIDSNGVYPGSGIVLTAPIQFPHNAELQACLVTYTDTSGSKIEFELRKIDIATNTFTQLGPTINSNDSSGTNSQQVINISPSETVDNSSYAYFILADFNGAGGADLNAQEVSCLHDVSEPN